MNLDVKRTSRHDYREAITISIQWTTTYTHKLMHESGYGLRQNKATELEKLFQYLPRGLGTGSALLPLQIKRVMVSQHVTT